MEKIFLASDHAAYKAKAALVEWLSSGYEVIDLGTHSEESVHYPTYAQNLALEVRKNKAKGILLCGSGIGVSIVANRYKGIRAALCRDEEDARLARQHNDANVLCLSGRKNSIDEIERITEAFLSSSFEGGRHQTRIDLFNQQGE